MDFPSQLEKIVVSLALKEGANTASSSSDDKLLTDWNDEIETFLSKPPTKDVLSQEVNDEELRSSLKIASTNLHSLLLLAVSQSIKSTLPDDDNGNDEEASTREAIAQFVESQKPCDDTSLFRYIRTGKNLLRWYIQVYLERQGLPPNENPIRVLGTMPTLELMVILLKWSLDNTNDSSDEENRARYCSLYLFYATYCPHRDDLTTSQGMRYLLTGLDFPNVALDILTRTKSISLALSLVRNLHNMAVSMPGAGKVILGSQLQWDPSTSRHVAPWSPKESCLISIQSICVDLLNWLLELSPKPEFTGEDLEDKRSELVVEILRSFYALRIGESLKFPAVSPTSDGAIDSKSLGEIITRMFQLLPPTSEATSTGQQVGNGVDQFQICAVTLLMDSHPSFGRYLLETNSTQSLSHILTVQVNYVVDNNRVDSSATAALVPILAVLNKYASGDETFQQMVKDFVFPPGDEANFQARLQEYIASKGSDGSGAGKKSANMSPLDAPKNTLRGKLVLLLSWPESYIKRCTAELLWTLCNADANEYVHRVGFGNALPLLNAKGLAALPVATKFN